MLSTGLADEFLLATAQDGLAGDEPVDPGGVVATGERYRLDVALGGLVRDDVGASRPWVVRTGIGREHETYVTVLGPPPGRAPGVADAEGRTAPEGAVPSDIRPSIAIRLQSPAMSAAVEPKLGREVYIAPTAYVGGDVVIGEQTTIMHQAVIRGDIAPIRVGARVNVQDGAVLHTAYDTPLEVGDEVSVGHQAVVHGRRVGARSLIGIGAILLDDCVIGSRCIIAAGTVLAPNTVIPDGSVVLGVPGRVVREVTDRDLEAIDHVGRNYLALRPLHASGRYPNIAAP